VTEELRTHWELHGIDERAAALELSLAALPGRRRASEARVAAARSALETLDRRVAESVKRRRALEVEIAALLAQQKRFEQQQLSVTNQQQYEAMQHEIAGVRSSRDGLETEALERLEADDRDAAARPELAHALERAEAEAATTAAEVGREESAARAGLAELDARRQALAQPLAPAARQHYERLRSGRGGQAVAVIVQQACGACHRALPPAGLQAARRRESLLTCDGCGRLLMLPPEEPSGP
jgi:hypothetical protein